MPLSTEHAWVLAVRAKVRWNRVVLARCFGENLARSLHGRDSRPAAGSRSSAGPEESHQRRGPEPRAGITAPSAARENTRIGGRPDATRCALAAVPVTSTTHPPFTPVNAGCTPGLARPTPAYRTARRTEAAFGQERPFATACFKAPRLAAHAPFVEPTSPPRAPTLQPGSRVLRVNQWLPAMATSRHAQAAYSAPEKLVAGAAFARKNST